MCVSYISGRSPIKNDSIIEIFELIINFIQYFINQKSSFFYCFDIEIKFPSDNEVSELELLNLPDKNSMVDTILEVVFNSAGDRNLFFSSFDSEICHLLSRKQSVYPVFFLTELGKNSNQNSKDSLESTIEFVKSNDIDGIVS